MSKKQVMRRTLSQGAWRGAPRNKPVVYKLGNKSTPKPKGSHGGKMVKVPL